MTDKKLEEANRIAARLTSTESAYGVHHHPTIKTKPVKKAPSPLTGPQIVAGIAVAVFVLLLWAAIQFAPLM